MRSGIERRELWRDCSVQWDREKGTVEGLQCAVGEREGNCGGSAVCREREKGTVEGLQCAVGEREGNCGGTAVCRERERRELWRDCSAQWDREKGTVEGLQCAVG